MNKAALIDAIVERTGAGRNMVENVVATMLDVVVKQLQDGDSVNLTGFGKYSARVRSARMGVDPQNPSARITIPEVVVPKFKAGKGLKDSLKHSQGARRKEGGTEGGEAESPTPLGGEMEAPAVEPTPDYSEPAV